MIRTSIDIGSNSVLLLVAEVDENRIVKILENEQRITALGRGIDESGRFDNDSMMGTTEALKEYSAILDKHSIRAKDVVVTATEASRVATNAYDFYRKIERELGFVVSIISGEDEAYYTAVGVATDLRDKHGEFVIIDMGGASTELIRIMVNPFKIVNAISLPFGSVRAELWLHQNKFETNMKKAIDQLEIGEFIGFPVVAVAGTYTTLAAMAQNFRSYSDMAVHKYQLEMASVEKLKTFLLSSDNQQVMDRYPVVGKRISSIRGGVLVADFVGKLLKTDKHIISTRGLRYGTIIHGITP